MKTSTLPPALQSLREEGMLLSKSAAPKLSYRQAVDAFFVVDPGQVCQVAECSIEEFKAFVIRCIATAKNPKYLERALVGLDYNEKLGRWYALDSMSVYGATVPLYP